MQAQAPKGNKPKSRQSADEAMLQEMRRAQAAQQELQAQARQNAANAQVNKPGYTPVNRAAAAKKAVKAPNFQTVPPGNAVNAKAPVRQNPLPPVQTPGAQPNRAANAPVPNKPGAATQPQGPLSGNPEVLNFLRNVAELMEKDGKGEIAKSIHKNLNAKNASGLT